MLDPDGSAQMTSTLREHYGIHYGSTPAGQSAGEGILDHLNIKETLGSGTMGRVRLVEDVNARKALEQMELVHPSNCFLALKVMKKSEAVRMKQVQHIKSEKDILEKVNHPFIITLYYAFQDERNLYMLLEFIVGGELSSHLRRVGKFSNDHTRFYAAQIVMAVQYLHGLNVAYRDLKPENLLLDETGYLKIVDFGFAKVIDGKSLSTTICGTPEYLAPEIIKSQGHNKAVDWWALGILLYEMLAGFPPFYAEDTFSIYQKILACKLGECPLHFEKEARDLIRRLLVADRTKRIGSLKNGAEDIKKHKWYRGLNWAALYNKQMEAYIVPDVQSYDDTSQYEKYVDSTDESGPLLNADKDWEMFGAFTSTAGWSS